MNAWRVILVPIGLTQAAISMDFLSELQTLFRAIITSGNLSNETIIIIINRLRLYHAMHVITSIGTYF